MIGVGPPRRFWAEVVGQDMERGSRDRAHACAARLMSLPNDLWPASGGEALGGSDAREGTVAPTLSASSAREPTAQA